jgi:hypothetical protein
MNHIPNSFEEARERIQFLKKKRKEIASYLKNPESIYEEIARVDREIILIAEKVKRALGLDEE